MSDIVTARSGARILVDQLQIHGADTVFCVPGESYLSVLDALYDTNTIQVVTCRQEGGAAMMADAYGKLTGRPGICMVTRGPGTTNASAGLHVATQDSTPMILFIGQVARDSFEREAFQEIDYRRMLSPLAKWVAQIDDPRRIPEFVSRAFHVATSGRPGPVVLALPEDMLIEDVSVSDAPPWQQIETWPGAGPMAEFQAALNAAARPMIILGGGAWNAEAVAHLERFALANKIPVACSFRRQDRFDNTHPCYAGDVGIGINPVLGQHIQDSDLLIAVGTRLGEIATGGYTLIGLPTPVQRLIHIHPDANEIGRIYHPFLGINCSPRAFARMLPALEAIPAPRWEKWTTQINDAYRIWRKPQPNPGAVQIGEIMMWLEAHLPADAIMTNGAGNFAGWLHRFHQYRGFGTQLAPTSGSMGYGLPGAVAAKLVHPERTVICFTGDGDFLMTGQELATAVKHGLGIVVLLFNNGMYGTIRMHQERHYPARVIGTDLHNPDFSALAQAYGAFGVTVKRTEDFAPAFQKALAAKGPALIEIRIDPDASTTRETLSGIRAKAMRNACE